MTNTEAEESHALDGSDNDDEPRTLRAPPVAPLAGGPKSAAAAPTDQEPESVDPAAVPPFEDSLDAEPKSAIEWAKTYGYIPSFGVLEDGPADDDLPDFE